MLTTVRPGGAGFQHPQECIRVDGLGLEQLLLAWTGNDVFVATATALGLHRNTVSTRIQRIQELLGVDLTDPEVRLALHLACRTIRL